MVERVKKAQQVFANYSSGKPAIGVGAGNTSVVIDETADIKRAVASILMSKTFDNGVICASEQSVIVVDSVYDAVRERFSTHAGYLLQGKELAAIQSIILKNGSLNAAIVGQAAPKIAEMAGFTVPAGTKVLIGEVVNVDWLVDGCCGIFVNVFWMKNHLSTLIQPTIWLNTEFANNRGRKHE